MKFLFALTAATALMTFAEHPAAAAPGDFKASFTCAASSGESNTEVVDVVAIRAGSSIYATEGDGAIPGALGYRSFHKVLETKSGLKLHAYLIGMKGRAQTSPLAIRRIGLRASKDGAFVGAPGYFTFRDSEAILDRKIPVSVSLGASSDEEISFSCSVIGSGPAKAVRQPRRPGRGTGGRNTGNQGTSRPKTPKPVTSRPMPGMNTQA